ncbi:MAG: serine hydroxymethyltransferase [Candidatus Buchananbacteria bacterium RIFCSPHIGHO2_01_FULL_39_14]|uniref:Serine hydroxymethyltransferase n=2 Tax=Candidatus Buchananiibacteriota TaxID=1817903 RepID=A0A1G1YVX2_9BACT|nr:MAG: serine hydroxymethyltransferase [Candidatus Buchananbacteria bacterium RIFCSPHIGHO2_01_FULL_39_14]OGY49183.1 MAG: serine hydroxymethyltransferase [Candidatus Buchananbacteria bacterium RIFCSPHIGHO2_02_FULL_39_17]OGY55916.1 MAG: serine hydroxymethyltransferase [Candidatus Buchananbacteria bacterium RIFCSPLOWO2_01_FULL_40_23b]
MIYQSLKKQDPEIAELIQKEIDRQKNGLVMIPSENHCSVAVLEAMGTVLSNKYAEGYPQKRYYTGNQYIDQIEQLAIDRAKKLFSAEHANVQPNAGSPANLAIYLALLKPGDKVMGMKLDQGGHLTHGHPVNLSGQLYNFVQYGVRKDTEQIDLDEIREMAKKEKPKMIVTGATAYPRIFDFKAFRKICDEVDAILLADISHFVGLCLSDDHPKPFPFADVVMTTTHKTLRGPRSAIILTKKEYAKAIDKAIFPGTQGGPLENMIAAKAVCFAEAAKPEFKTYAHQIVLNAKTLAETFIQEGLELVSGGTDNHLMLIKCAPLGLTGRQGSEALAQGGIYTNRNTIPYDTGTAFEPTGIRLGTPALTSRGMKEGQMKIIGKIIAKVLKNINNDNILKELKDVVAQLCQEFPVYKEMTI